MPLTAAQKGLVTQFIQLSGATDKTAQRYLKNANYKLEVALDSYYAANGSSPAPNSAKTEAALDKMFDDLRNPDEDEKDSIGAESMMNYSQSLGADPENCELFVVLDIVQAPGFGQITRSGYVNGWKATGASASLSAHKQYVRQQIASLSTDASYFKQVYRQAFIAGKEEAQKALPLENALVYWDLLFTEPGRAWRTDKTDWLKTWKTFLESKWTRSVNKDMWNQTLEFAQRSMEDETLGFWNEDGAWPGVIDDFVAWCRETGVVKPEVMEIDD